MHDAISFRLADKDDKGLIHDWWHKPHVVAFRDNSPEMWANVEANLDQGIKDTFDYWLASREGVPFALAMACDMSSTSGNRMVFRLLEPGLFLSSTQLPGFGVIDIQWVPGDAAQRGTYV